MLDISNVTIMQKKTKETAWSASAIEPITAAMPAASVPNENVAYMAGYVIKQYPIDNCSTYSDLLKVDNLPETSPISQYELLRFKTYKDTFFNIPKYCLLKLYKNTLLFHIWWCNAPKWLAQDIVQNWWKRHHWIA